MAEWTDHSGTVPYQAGGDSNVLIIVSEDVQGPDVVPRKAAIELTEGCRKMLESQGITRPEDQSDDLAIAKARYNLDKMYTITGVESGTSRGRLTREKVLQRIKTLMTTSSDKAGVVLHYIGAGRRDTGDWCFEDGFITFKDVAHFYIQFLRGHALWIVADCSHSGSWVKECITFMTEQGVGPCGHLAKDKGILISPYASCLTYQVPRKLAFSVFSNRNDATGLWVIYTDCCLSLSSKVVEGQHGRGIESTEVRCGRNFIAERCLCLPHASWQTWSARQRLCRVRHGNSGRRGWYLVLVKDNDETVIEMLQRGKVDVERDSEILASGWGEAVPEETMQSVLKKYQVYQEAGEAFFIDQGIVVEASDCNITQPGPGGSAPLGKRKSHPTSTGVTVTASRKSVRTSRQPTRLKYDQPGTPTPLN